MMELYTLDSLYRREEVIDVWQSMLWTERMAVFGDFQLVVYSNQNNKRRYFSDLKLGSNFSKRVMTVETVVDSTDDQGIATLTITGRSLEFITDNRLAVADGFDNTTTSPQWVITDTPINIAKKLFHDICVTGVLDAADVIPLIHEGSTTLFPTDTIAASTDVITVLLDPVTVYEDLTKICPQYGLGFRLCRNGDVGELWFDIFTGCDRTTGQHTLPAVIFSPDLGNLQNTSELNSIANYKNVAYVISPVGQVTVSALDVDPEIPGFSRRIVIVNASDVTKDWDDPSHPTTEEILTQRGYDELAKWRPISTFDGEISPNSKYIYGRDYNIGDMIERRDVAGEITAVQVTEQIFSSDNTGEKAYPTLTVNAFITPGSWLGWDPTQHWDDVAGTVHWDDL